MTSTNTGLVHHLKQLEVFLEGRIRYIHLHYACICIKETVTCQIGSSTLHTTFNPLENLHGPLVHYCRLAYSVHPQYFLSCF